ncbi:hypothetical protein [Sphingomonas sp. LHG3443-2]|uniref:hypothetical protein n=1 Tax=Sphingomonas sp. LHG3443-2 TaxID=2804639 RepID=UPI003CF9A37E
MAGAKNLIIMIVAGLIAGSGGGAAVAFLVPAQGGEKPREEVTPGDSTFESLGPLLVPLIFADGKFTGYVRMEAQLEVGSEDAEGVKARLPLVIHAVNVRAYNKPLAGGPDGRLPDAAAFRTIVAEEAGKVLGKGVVRSVALTSIAPA